MNTELVTIPKESALQVFTTIAGLDPYLAQVRAEIDAFRPNLETKKGRAEVASLAYKVAKIKTYLDGVGKDLADVQKEIPKKIDAERKRIRDTLDAWKDEVRKPLTEWEEAEENRITTIKAVLAEWQACADDRHLGHTSESIRGRLHEMEAEEVSEDFFGEYLEAAVVLKGKALLSLGVGLEAAEKREAEALELEKLRAEKAERDRKDAEARAQKEAEERQARIEREKVQAAQDAAEREKKAAEAREKAQAEAAAKREAQLKVQAEQAEKAAQEAQERAARAEIEAKAKMEREAQAKAQAEAAEQAKRDKDKALRARVNNAAVAAFVQAGLVEDVAKTAVTLIAKGMIPGITIKY